jgi:hypothetical protein
MFFPFVIRRLRPITRVLFKMSATLPAQIKCNCASALFAIPQITAYCPQSEAVTLAATSTINCDKSQSEAVENRWTHKKNYEPENMHTLKHPTTKLSRAADPVNRECGTKRAIGGGSGELLGG